MARNSISSQTWPHDALLQDQAKRPKPTSHSRSKCSSWFTERERDAEEEETCFLWADAIAESRLDVGLPERPLENISAGTDGNDSVLRSQRQASKDISTSHKILLLLDLTVKTQLCCGKVCNELTKLIYASSTRILLFRSLSIISEETRLCRE